MYVKIPVFVEGIDEEKKIVVSQEYFKLTSKEADNALSLYNNLLTEAKNLGYEIVFAKSNRALALRRNFRNRFHR